LFGAPVGIEGPSIHIGSSIFYNFATFIKLKRKLLIHAFITIGGSVGLLVAFNSPLAAISFAFEEMGRELKKQAKILIGLVVALTFLLLIFLRGNNPYLGDFSISFNISGIYKFILPVIIIGVVCGVLGGIFAKLSTILINKITGKKFKILGIVFILGTIIAWLNYLSNGVVAGSGHLETMQILSGVNFGFEFAIMKFLATLSSVVSVIPGGIFMPSISIGAGLGALFVEVFNANYQIIIILSMVAYLSAVIRAPWTASLVVLEMTTSLNLLPLALIIALISSFISSKIQKKTLFTILSEKFNYKK
jgi:H+/Cl- antiporter ClcA